MCISHLIRNKCKSRGERILKKNVKIEWMYLSGWTSAYVILHCRCMQFLSVCTMHVPACEKMTRSMQ